jgi:aspartate racemase
VQPVGIHDNFFALGGHSLLAVRLFAQMQQQLQISVPLASLFQAPSIAQLAAVIRQGGAETSPPLLAFRTDGSRWPLFSVHFGGEGMARYVESDRPWYGLYLPSMDGHPDPRTVEALAANYIKRMRLRQPAGPYVLAGSSFGGLVAFEMAQQLRHQDQEVALLVLVDPVYARQIRRTIWQQLKRPGRKIIWRLGEWFLQRGRRVPSLLYQGYMNEVMIRAGRAYIPQGYPGRIVLFQAAEDGKIPHQVWYPLATEGLDIHTVPGDHFSMLKEPHIHTFLQGLMACLQQAEALHTHGESAAARPGTV